MSSNEDEFEEGPFGLPHGSKKRRIQRACDICRRKKIRCDGVQMPGNRCSNCTSYGFKCTYVETAKKRGPTKGYVEGLEHKIEKMDKLLRRLCPDESVYHSILNAMEKDNGTLEQESLDPKSISRSQPVTKPVTLLDSVTTAIRTSHLGQNAVGEAEDFGLLIQDLKSLNIESPEEDRFFGKSSGIMLIHKLMEAKIEYAGRDDFPLRNYRPEFWIIPEWEKAARRLVSSRQLDLPPTDLAEGLIDLYFRHVNLYLPLLHRPTFDEGIKADLHHTDTGFASVYMLVCSLASKFSDDLRVKCDGETSSHSAGWKWFNQVIASMKTPMSAATLYDLQSYALAVQFLAASASPQNCWTLIGIGLRVAQDVGAHMKTPRNRSLHEEELWKRAFWVLFVLDRLFSATLGRSCAIQEEDFDLDLPNDCDDEYWTNACFQQPEGLPSKITAFILLIKLTRILSVTLRTIYVSNKCKISWGFPGSHWEKTVVTELDSALNSWVDLVPAHLRWDPNREDKELFDQSVILYSNYYFLQIIVHRPFIPTPSKPSPLSFPSLAICANAARSCSHLADLQRRRTTLSAINQMPVCTSAIILLLNLWSGKESGLSNEVVKRDMDDVLMCMQALKSVEKRWQAAGRLWDLLYKLAYVGDLPFPNRKPASSNKRPRGSNGPHESKEAPPNENRNIAGFRRAQKEPTFKQISQQNSPGGSHQASPGSNSSVSEPSIDSPSFVCPSPQCEKLCLPMYSKELGQLPPHGPFTFGAPQSPPGSTETTPSSTGLGGWYPTYTEVDQLSSYSTSSSFNPQSMPGLLAEMSSLTGDSPPAMNPAADPTRSGLPLHRFLQDASPFAVASPINQDGPFNVPNSGIPEPHLRRPVQGHQQQLGNLSQMDPGMVMPGIDMSTMNSDVMSMWLNSSPSMLTDEWGAYFATFGPPPNLPG